MTGKTLPFWLLPPFTTSFSTIPPLAYWTLVLPYPHCAPLPGSFPAISFHVFSTSSSFQGSSQVSHSLRSLFVTPPTTAMSYISWVSLLLYPVGCHSQKKSCAWSLEVCKRVEPHAILCGLSYSPTVGRLVPFASSSRLQGELLNVRAVPFLYLNSWCPTQCLSIASSQSLLNNGLSKQSNETFQCQPQRKGKDKNLNYIFNFRVQKKGQVSWDSLSWALLAIYSPNNKTN